MTPEAFEKQRLFEQWAATLPEYIPLIDGSIPDRWNWADVDGVHDYVGFPRNQGLCGVCWLFSIVGVLENQYNINCCYFGDCLCRDVPAGDCVCPASPLDLSEQLVLECSRQGYFHDCSGSHYTAVEEFITNIGTTYEYLEPFELADGQYDLPYLKICPIQDRGDPNGGYSARNLVSDIKDKADAMGIALYYYRAVSGDGTSAFRTVYSSQDDFTNLAATINEGHVAYSVHGSHAMLIVGYERYDPSDPGDLTLIVRNSHNEHDVGRSTAGENGFGITAVIVDLVEKYAPDSSTGYPDYWLYAEPDSDGDGILNVVDPCLYSPDGGYDDYNIWRGSRADGDHDMWPDDEITAGGKIIEGCDACPGIPAVERGDRDGDGRPDVCDGCPDDPERDYTYLRCMDSDGDHVCDECDNCPSEPNPEQKNSDSDSLGDACDACPNGDMGGDPQEGYERGLGVPGGNNCIRDIDGDDICDNPVCDNCPEDINVEQWDVDWDGIGNICDGCPFNINGTTYKNYASPNSPYPSDPLPAGYESWPRCVINSDGDNHCEYPACDNCPDIENMGDAYGFQSNVDADAAGDACDGCPHDSSIDFITDPADDSDGDGLANICDICSEDNPTGSINPMDNSMDDKSNPDRIDEDGDDFGDRCDGCPNDPGRFPPVNLFTDPDLDGLADECDLCDDDNPTGSPNGMDNPVDDVSLAPSLGTDSDGDLVGNRCDNCAIANPYQENCNYEYETNPFWNFPELGDACDPDPCVAICEESDPEARWGRCSFDENTDIVQSHVIMSEFYSMSSSAAEFMHYDLGIGVGGTPFKREAQQVYWCSCWDESINDWFESDYECSRWQCKKQGETDRFLHPVTKLPLRGWYETIRRDGGYVRYECDEDESGWCSAPPCAPWDPDQDIRTCTYRASLPDMPAYYHSLPRIDGAKNHEIIWTDSHLKYPENTPEEIIFGFRHKLKFWVKPIRLYTMNPGDESTYEYPLSIHPRVNSHSHDANWNNLYTHFQDLEFVSFDFGYVDIHEITNSNGRWLVPAASKIVDYPGKIIKLGRDIIWVGEKDECPSYPWPWAEAAPGYPCATYGMPVLHFDAHSQSFKGAYPSRAAGQEIPFETGMAAAVMTGPSAVAADGSEIIAFGGVNAAGSYSNATWRATKGEIENGMTGFLWEKLDVGGIQHSPPELPSPRADAAMFSNPDGGEILLFGGEDASGYLSDMWALDPEYIAPEQRQYTWKRVASYGHVPVPRSGVSIAQDGGTAVVYGGITENGPSDEVHLFDIRSRRWKRIETDAGGPSVRQEASIEYDPAKRIMYLYGGSDGAGCHNDLWDLDLSTGEWNRMIPDCTEGVCPTPDRGSIVLKDPASGNLTVIPADEGPAGDVYYIPYEHGWISQAEHEGAPRTGDCDGDGIVEPEYGLLCPTGDEWWSAPGMLVCDSATGGLVCSPSETLGEEIASIRARGATAFDIDGSYVWLTRQRRLECYDASVLPEVNLVSYLDLPRRAADIKVSDGYAYVASDWRILIIDIRDPEAPHVASEVTTCGRAKSVAVNGSVLAVASSGGIGLIDVSDPSDPEGLGMLWIFPTGYYTWTEEGSMDECGNLSGFQQVLLDITGMFGGFGELIEREDNTLFAASRKTLMSFYIKNNHIPALVGSISFWKRIKGMRLHRNFIYLNMANREGVIVDTASPLEMNELGSHDIDWWVRGQSIEGGRVYLLYRGRFKAADVMPGMGWIW